MIVGLINDVNDVYADYVVYMSTLHYVNRKLNKHVQWNLLLLNRTILYKNIVLRTCVAFGKITGNF